MNEYQEALKNLYTNNLNLYVKSILQQYGLADKQALEIVSSLTEVSKEELIKLREEVYSNAAAKVKKLQKLL